MTFEFFKRIAAKYGYYVSRFQKPSITVDLVLWRATLEGKIEVALIKRGGEPFKNCLALCGGFVNIDERLRSAVVREAKEEIGVTLESTQLVDLGIWDQVDRDKRDRVLTYAYAYEYHEECGALKAGDDAAAAAWYDVNDILLSKSFPLSNDNKLAFDHFSILLAARPHMG